MPRKSLPVSLSESEITRLGQWLRAGSTPQQTVLRAQIILQAARGQSDLQIAGELKIQRRTAALWRREVARIVKATLQSKPKGSTHWSTRTLARASVATRFFGSGKSINSSRI